MLNDLDPTNWFAMGGLNMAFASNLTREGKPLPKTLFIDIMMEKTQMLINHLKHLHLGLSLTANINENVATVRLYDNYAPCSYMLLYQIYGILKASYSDYGLRWMVLYKILCLH